MDITDTNMPPDATPVTDSSSFTGEFTPGIPDSTPDAPYGYFANGNPRKTPPKAGRSKPAASRSTPASESQARTAAGLLSRINGLVGISLGTFGLPTTAMSLAVANEQFESMAFEALLADPALCKKILSAGATSGKTGLIFAYGMLGASIAPAAFSEIKDIRNVD